MTAELDFIALLRTVAASPGARGLLDDVAVFDGLVLTHDTIAEGVHYLAGDPPESVAGKLVAVTLSDLAAKGAAPAGALLAYCLGEEDWDWRFTAGLGEALAEYGCPLLGGDTIALPDGAPRVLGLTAIGRAGPRVPDRAGGRPGDELWLAGTLGDSAAGLAMLLDDPAAAGPLVEAYRRPRALFAEGQALAPHASAMMDVSDGLLIDLQRLAAASGCAARVELDALPLSEAFRAARGEGLEARLFAATGGDDYALLAALPPRAEEAVGPPGGIFRIGALAAGSGITLGFRGADVPVPGRPGYEHRR